MFEVRFVFKFYLILNRRVNQNDTNNTRTLYVIIKSYILRTALSAERNDQQQRDIEGNKTHIR